MFNLAQVRLKPNSLDWCMFFHIVVIFFHFNVVNRSSDVGRSIFILRFGIIFFIDVDFANIWIGW